MYICLLPNSKTAKEPHILVIALSTGIGVGISKALWEHSRKECYILTYDLLGEVALEDVRDKESKGVMILENNLWQVCLCVWQGDHSCLIF